MQVVLEEEVQIGAGVDEPLFQCVGVASVLVLDLLADVIDGAMFEDGVKKKAA